jgi:hypothetical protein
VCDTAAEALARIGTPEALAAFEAFKRGEIKPRKPKKWWQFWRRD